MDKFTRDLKIGDEGIDVLDAQKKLIKSNYNKVKINDQIIELDATGYFREVTKECVKQFQIAANEMLSKIKEKEKDNLKNYKKNYRSDKRKKGGKKDICILCGNEKLLKLSHIIPKWSYYWIKQEDRGRIIGQYESLGVKIIEQDGNKHYLICGNCEQFLGDAENYVKILMHGSDDEKKKYNIVEKNEIFEKFNFELLQRFIFGLTLKAHYASSAPFHGIILTDDKISSLRKRILYPSGEDMDYPIIAMRFYSEIAPGIDPKAMMIPYYQKTKSGDELISYLLGGWEWVIFFNTKRNFNEKMITDYRLTKEGTFIVPSGDITQQRFINRGIPYLKNKLSE